MTEAWLFFGAVVIVALFALAWAVGGILRERSAELDTEVSEAEAAENCAPHQPHVQMVLPASGEHNGSIHAIPDEESEVRQ